MAYESNNPKSRKKHVQSVEQPQKRFNDVRFVNYELSKEEAETVKKYWPDYDVAGDQIDQFLEDGFKLSQKFDETSGGYAAFAFQGKAGGPNQGMMLTGRGSTALKAVRQLLYKHYVVMEGDWEAWCENSQKQEFND